MCMCSLHASKHVNVIDSFDRDALRLPCVLLKIPSGVMGPILFNLACRDCKKAALIVSFLWRAFIECCRTCICWIIPIWVMCQWILSSKLIPPSASMLVHISGRWLPSSLNIFQSIFSIQWTLKDSATVFFISTAAGLSLTKWGTGNIAAPLSIASLWHGILKADKRIVTILGCKASSFCCIWNYSTRLGL